MKVAPIKLLIIFIIVSSLSQNSFAQKNDTNNTLEYTSSHKGKIFISWGDYLLI